MDMSPLIIGHQDNEVLLTHPLHNISPKAVMNAYIYFEENNYDLYCEKNGNGIWDSDNVDEKYHKNGHNKNNQMSDTAVSDDIDVDGKSDDDESFTMETLDGNS